MDNAKSTFTAEQITAWDNYLHQECEQLLDSLTLEQLPLAIKAAGIRPSQLFAKQELIGEPMREINRLKERMLGAVHDLIYAAGFQEDEVCGDDALDDWALAHGFIRDPKGD